MITGTLLMIGCGNMGRAMLDRWLASGLSPSQVTVVSPSGRAMPQGVTVVPSVPSQLFDTVVLGLKPQQLEQVAASLAKLEAGVLLSILAGVRVEKLVALCPSAKVVRAMPNLPVAIGKGVTALYSDDESARETAEALAKPLGLVEWIADEQLFDVMTALSGCGPAFLFRFIDALAEAGTALGLPADQAARLALATVEGAALMAAAAPDSPATLADKVASPGGSTRAGLNVLDDDEALKVLLQRTLAASEVRNAELAHIAKG